MSEEDKIDMERLALSNIHLFNEYYKITNDQGQPLDFEEHPFMWDVFNDWSPIIVGMKAAQVTWSTTFNIKALYAAKMFGIDIIYSLPTVADVGSFVGGKVNKLIANNPIFQEWTQDKDTIEQKQIGKSTIYYRGTWTDRAALMIPADLYISDEMDRSKQDVVRQFETRLQHSKFGWRWYFSNPSAPGVGVDKYWEQSDQKHWFLKCEACNHYQFLTMENIQGSPAQFVCTKCGAPLNRKKGKWVKRYEDREISGYWVSLLMCPWVSAEEILRKQKEMTEEQFSNFVLGKPFVGKGNTLTRNLLFQNLIDKANPQDARPIIGVDTGVDIRYVIGNKYGIYYYGECKDYSELEKLMERMPNAVMVIDQGGDIIGPRKLRERFKNRVYLCFYRADRKNDELLTWDDMGGSVTADRNKMIQLLVDEFMEKRIPLYGKESEWLDYWLHWSHIYRVAEEDSLGRTVYKWHRSDRDDWVHATVYWRIGMDRFTEQFAEFIGPTDSIGSTGYSPDESGEARFFPKIVR